MQYLSLLRYDFSADLMMPVLQNETLTWAFDRRVHFAYHSNGTTTLRLLAPERFARLSLLQNILDPQGNAMFASEASSIGERWQVFHVEPVYGPDGRFNYWYHHIKRYE